MSYDYMAESKTKIQFCSNYGKTVEAKEFGFRARKFECSKCLWQGFPLETTIKDYSKLKF